MSKPVVLIAEELSPATIEALGPDFEVRSVDGADRDELLPALADADAVLIRSATRMDAEAIAAARRLKVIARAGVGLDNVDVESATQAGIMVVNAPTSNITSAAELAVGLLLATARNIAPANQALKAGAWKRSKLLRRRAARQDGRRRRSRPHRRARRRAAQGLRHADPRLRPLRLTGQGRAARSTARRPRRAARPVRLHHHPPAQDAGDDRPHRRGGADEGQAVGAHRQRRPRRHPRRGGTRSRHRRGSGRRCRHRRLRHRADDRVAALRARVRRRHTPPRAPRPRRPRRRPVSPSRGRCASPSAASSCPTPSTSPPASSPRRSARASRSSRSSAASSPPSPARCRRSSTSTSGARSPPTTSSSGSSRPSRACSPTSSRTP